MGETDTTSWHGHGLCRKSPDLFYPERKDKEMAANAVAICMRCPVRQPCRQHALDEREQYGVWGGTTELERERIRRGRKVA